MKISLKRKKDYKTKNTDATVVAEIRDINMFRNIRFEKGHSNLPIGNSKYYNDIYDYAMHNYSNEELAMRMIFLSMTTYQANKLNKMTDKESTKTYIRKYVYKQKYNYNRNCMLPSLNNAIHKASLYDYDSNNDSLYGQRNIDFDNSLSIDEYLLSGDVMAAPKEN